MELVKLMKNLANYCNLPNLSKFLLPMFFIVQYIDASTPNIIINCDQACENRAYLHIKFGLFLNFNFFIKYRYATETIWLTIYLECTWSLQNLSVVNTEQEKFHSVNVHILCRYAWVLQAQSNTRGWTEFWGYCFIKMVFLHQAKH